MSKNKSNAQEKKKKWKKIFERAPRKSSKVASMECPASEYKLVIDNIMIDKAKN